MPSGMEETTTFLLAGAALTVACRVPRLVYAPSDVRLFSADSDHFLYVTSKEISFFENESDHIDQGNSRIFARVSSGRQFGVAISRGNHCLEYPIFITRSHTLDALLNCLDILKEHATMHPVEHTFIGVQVSIVSLIRGLSEALAISRMNT